MDIKCSISKALHMYYVVPVYRSKSYNLALECLSRQNSCAVSKFTEDVNNLSPVSILSVLRC